MKRIDLIKVEHNTKIGDKCGAIPPNITEDSIFYEDGKPIGFFIENISGKLKDYIEIANKEFRSKNVPKKMMNRSSAVKAFNEGGMKAMKDDVQQFCTILGATPPKPHMRRPYPSISSVHKRSKS